MAWLDLHNRARVEQSISVRAVSDNTAQVGAIIDIEGFSGLEFIINLGTINDADATFAFTLEEGDDSGLSDTAAVAADNIQGSGDFQFDSDDSVRRVGYFGKKRFVRATITPSNNTSAADMSVSAVLYMAREMPTDENV